MPVRVALLNNNPPAVPLPAIEPASCSNSFNPSTITSPTTINPESGLFEGTDRNYSVYVYQSAPTIGNAATCPTLIGRYNVAGNQPFFPCDGLCYGVRYRLQATVTYVAYRDTDNSYVGEYTATYDNGAFVLGPIAFYPNVRTLFGGVGIGGLPRGLYMYATPSITSPFRPIPASLGVAATPATTGLAFAVYFRVKTMTLNYIVDPTTPLPAQPCKRPGYNDGQRYMVWAITSKASQSGTALANPRGANVYDDLLYLVAGFNTPVLRWGPVLGARTTYDSATSSLNFQLFDRGDGTGAILPTAQWNTFRTLSTASVQEAETSSVVYLAQAYDNVPGVGNFIKDSYFAEVGNSFESGTSCGNAQSIAYQSTSAVLYRNRPVPSNWACNGDCIQFNLQDYSRGSAVIGQVYPSIYHSPVITASNIANLKRAQHLYLHFDNELERMNPDDHGFYPVTHGANAGVTYAYSEGAQVSTDVYVNWEQDYVDPSAGKEYDKHLLFKQPLIGSSYGWQANVWSVDERTWKLDGYELTFDVYPNGLYKGAKE